MTRSERPIIPNHAEHFQFYSGSIESKNARYGQIIGKFLAIISDGGDKDDWIDALFVLNAVTKHLPLLHSGPEVTVIASHFSPKYTSNAQNFPTMLTGDISPKPSV